MLLYNLKDACIKVYETNRHIVNSTSKFSGLRPKHGVSDGADGIQDHKCVDLSDREI